MYIGQRTSICICIYIYEYSSLAFMSCKCRCVYTHMCICIYTQPLLRMDRIKELDEARVEQLSSAVVGQCADFQPRPKMLVVPCSHVMQVAKIYRRQQKGKEACTYMFAARCRQLLPHFSVLLAAALQLRL